MCITIYGVFGNIKKRSQLENLKQKVDCNFQNASLWFFGTRSVDGKSAINNNGDRNTIGNQQIPIPVKNKIEKLNKIPVRNTT